MAQFETNKNKKCIIFWKPANEDLIEFDDDKYTYILCYRQRILKPTLWKIKMEKIDWW